MWQSVANIILRNRILILSLLFAITVVFGYFATKVGIQYEFANLLPSNDKTQIEYNQFKNDFGQDGMIIVCLLYTSPSPRDLYRSRMPSSA